MKSHKDAFRRDKSFAQQNIALGRIKKLFAEAESAFREHPELSKRYIILARKLSMRYKVKFTSEQKKLFCKKCDSYLKIGVNSRVRLEHGKLVQTCLECKSVRRMIYKK
jgi:ribonuclease P protein subunit RPR2